MSPWKIIGISGVSCGGKTTLVSNLLGALKGSIAIKQDTYFISKHSDRHEIIPELNHQNWESLKAVEWDAMLEKIKSLQQTSEPESKEAFLFVDGHIIYNYPKLQHHFDRRYFVTLSREECIKRRSVRTYDPPDPPGYFDLCVWPMYCQNKADMEKTVMSFIYIDGSESIDNVFNTVLADLKAAFHLP